MILYTEVQCIVLRAAEQLCFPCEQFRQQKPLYLLK